MTRFADKLRSGPGLALAGAALLAAGGALGAGAAVSTRPVVAMAPGAPVPIGSLAAASRPWLGEPVVTVRGRIAETYGHQFVLADGSGRTLVDIGPRGEAAARLAAGQAVTVQGRFDGGIVHARFLVGPDGRVAALGRGRGHSPDGHRGPHGRGGPGGPGRDSDGDDAPPPPPPAVAGQAVAAPAAPPPAQR